MIALLLVAVIAAALSSVCYTVNESQVAILMYFGKPEPKPIRSGLHFKWPIINTVKKYDRRLHVHVTNPITQTLKDKKTIILQAYLCWRIADPLRFYESVNGIQAAQQKLNDIASSALGSRISEYPITAIISTEPDKVKLAQVESEMKTHMAREMKGEYGITVERFGLNRLALPVANEWTVYDRMKSERAVAANEYKSDGEREAKVIRARANQAAHKTVNDAEAEATCIRGEGEAKATQIYRDAYAQDPEFYQFWRTLETYKKIFGPETTVVIPPDSELMKYFMSPAVSAPEKKGP